MYNEYELRFLQVLVSRDEYRDIVSWHIIQEIQGMKAKKVFILGDNEGLVFEDQ